VDRILRGFLFQHKTPDLSTLSAKAEKSSKQYRQKKEHEQEQKLDNTQQHYQKIFEKVS